MAYMFSGFSSACASQGGFGCSPFDDFFLDKSKVEYADTLYRDRYGRAIPERVAAMLRDQSGFCDRTSIAQFVETHPPTSKDKVAGEVLEKQQESGSSTQSSSVPAMNMGIMPPDDSSSSGLPSWAIPAAAAGVGLLAIVLVMKKRKKA